MVKYKVDMLVYTYVLTIVLQPTSFIHALMLQWMLFHYYRGHTYISTHLVTVGQHSQKRQLWCKVSEYDPHTYELNCQSTKIYIGHSMVLSLLILLEYSWLSSPYPSPPSN